MKARIITLAVAAALLDVRAAYAIPPTGPGLLYLDWQERNDRSEDPDPSEFTLINYFFTRGTATNQLADPAGLRGVSLGPFGQAAGSETRVGPGTEAVYIEQRWIPVLAYSPDFADGLATFRAQFEVDYLWGQAANQIQNNQGGGFNADQVNIQTKNVNVSIYPTRNPYKLAITVGTQSIYDTIYDPAITSLFDIVRTGYKLTFFGTDATGISAYSRIGGLWKASFIPIGAGQPNKATEDDPSLAFAWMATADYAYQLQPGTVVGVSYWHLQDDTQGSAFAFEGLVKSGPGSTGLFPYTGVARQSIEAASGNVEYLGAHFHHNINFRTGPFGASGFAMLNAGGFTSQREDTALNRSIDILGMSANLELMYNWGKTTNDKITFETMLTSGDSTPGDDKYTGAFTLNNYGLPGAVWFNHKTLLLFPFTQTVSNYTGAVTDISNQGFGLMSAIATMSYDLIPYKLNIKGGVAYAQSMVKPPATSDGVERGRTVGLEVNAELNWHIRYLMTVGLHVGYLAVGNFFDGNVQVLSDPWAAFTTFTWYAF